MNDLYNNLNDKIITQITADLTIGRSDNDLNPYTQEQINEFIQKNELNIKNTIENMINDCKEYIELEELNNPEDDWIREYLYCYIKYPISELDPEKIKTINIELEELNKSLENINNQKNELDKQANIIIENIRKKYRSLVKNGVDALKYLKKYISLTGEIHNHSIGYGKYEYTDDETDEDNDIDSDKYKISFGILKDDIFVGENLILELCSPYFEYRDSHFEPSEDEDINHGKFTMYMLLK